MAVLAHLEPHGVFSYFEQICAIPHGSYHTRGISDWLVDFARAHQLQYVRDAANNVIMWKSAAPGYEKAAPVILQGHMDMVCEQAPDCGKDMLREGLDLAVDGDTIYARGTTLGGDDGIAVAMMLALLEANDIPHPPLECVFTVDEEVGMLGAEALDTSPLKGRRMLNLDSEEEGVFIVSCAGGNVSQCTLPVKRECFVGTAMQLTVSGLMGGHSGAEIHKGRGNADMLMGRILYAVSHRTGMRLVSVCGGQKDNAIPRECTAVILVQDADTAQSVCAEMDDVLKHEYASTDGGITVTAQHITCDLPAMDKVSTDRAVCMLTCLPNGVQAMSGDMPGLVQTSLNLGILVTCDTAMEASFCVRSSVATQKEMLVDRLRCLMAQLGGTVTVSGDYPGWQYCPDSPLRELMTEVYTQQYGCPPVVEAMHAGVECGFFSDKLPGLDCVSYGPDLKEIHTCRETMSVSSVQRVWQMTLEILRRMTV
ncbi:MAG: aminoacyl-histidine dipeptidase [Clostridiales bacterium]|nr:aminoacyl-histidine dipeptidase [Candidatus Cacconaster stercorequi]